MKLSMPKLILVWCVLFSAMLYLTLKYDYLEKSFLQQPFVEGRNLREAAGKSAWQKNGCDGCHRINGVGNRIGPDLSRVGVRRDKSWLNGHLIKPKSFNSSSVMPAHSHIPDEERKDIVEYLSGLRGTAE